MFSFINKLFPSKNGQKTEKEPDAVNRRQSVLNMKTTMFGTTQSKFYKASRILQTPENQTALQIVFTYLDSKSLQSVRLVCKKWKEIADQHSGIQIMINDTMPGNTAFARLIVIRHGIFKNLIGHSDFLTLKSPDSMLSFDCIGPINAKFFNEKVLTCSNLTRIEISGVGLLAQDFCMEWNKSTNSKEIVFQQLKTLILSIDQSTWKKMVQLGREKTMDKSIIQIVWETTRRQSEATYLQQIVDRNIMYLLSKIRSPVLRNLYVADYPIESSKMNQSTFYPFAWKESILENFLRYHNKSIRRIYLPYYRNTSNFNNSNNNDTPSCYPQNLQTIEISFLQELLDRTGRDANFIEKILPIQTHLKEISISKHYLSSDSESEQAKPQNASNLLKNVICINQNTLKYIKLDLDCVEENLNNGEIYQHCEHLQYLLINFNNKIDGVMFKGIGFLPKSLIQIEILSGCLIQADELKEFSEFSKLQVIHLDGVEMKFSKTNLTKNNHIQFLRELLNLGRLFSIQIKFGIEKQSLHQSVIELDNNANLAYRGSSKEKIQTNPCAINDFQNVEIFRNDLEMEPSSHFLTSNPRYRNYPIDFNKFSKFY